MISESRNHTEDHPGCTAVYPWDRGCKRWTTAKLLRRAEVEMVGLPQEDGERFLRHMLQYPDYYRLKTGHRNAYIAAVEGWRRGDLESYLLAAEIAGSKRGWTALEVGHEAAHQWNLHRQQLAFAVLYVYGK